MFLRGLALPPKLFSLQLAGFNNVQYAFFSLNYAMSNENSVYVCSD